MQTKVQYCRYETYETGFLFEGPRYGSLGRLRGTDRGQNSTFSKYGHVAYQIKGIEACINLVATILPIYSLSGPRGGVKRSKFSFFRTWSCCLPTRSATCKHILCQDTHSRPLGWGQRSKHVFLHIKLM